MKDLQLKDMKSSTLERLLLEICDDAYPASNSSGRRSHLELRDLTISRANGTVILKLSILDGVVHRLSEDLTREEAAKRIREESTNFDANSGYEVYSVRTMEFIEAEDITKYFPSKLLNKGT